MSRADVFARAARAQRSPTRALHERFDVHELRRDAEHYEKLAQHAEERGDAAAAAFFYDAACTYTNPEHYPAEHVALAQHHERCRARVRGVALTHGDSHA